MEERNIGLSQKDPRPGRQEQQDIDHRAAAVTLRYDPLVEQQHGEGNKAQNGIDLVMPSDRVLRARARRREELTF
jgi:hypothetical protein